MRYHERSPHTDRRNSCPATTSTSPTRSTSALELSRPREDANDDAEPWILVAACASLGVERGLSQQRRRDEALARARAIDEDNPRIAFVEASLLANGPHATPLRRERRCCRVDACSRGFPSLDGPLHGPDVGRGRDARAASVKSICNAAKRASPAICSSGRC